MLWPGNRNRLSGSATRRHAHMQDVKLRMDGMLYGGQPRNSTQKATCTNELPPSLDCLLRGGRPVHNALIGISHCICMFPFSLSLTFHLTPTLTQTLSQTLSLTPTLLLTDARRSSPARC